MQDTVYWPVYGMEFLLIMQRLHSIAFSRVLRPNCRIVPNSPVSPLLALPCQLKPKWHEPLLPICLKSYSASFTSLKNLFEKGNRMVWRTGRYLIRSAPLHAAWRLNYILHRPVSQFMRMHRFHPRFSFAFRLWVFIRHCARGLW